MSGNPPISVGEPRRILVRGVNWLGDAVMTTPALLRLRERFPHAHIALLAPDKLTELWRGHPAVNEVVGFAPDDGAFAVGAKLRAGQFDLALVLPNSPRSALEVWLARIPTRIGYARPWRNWLLTHAVPTRTGHMRMRKRTLAEIRRLIAGPAQSRATIPETAHQLHEYLELAAALGASPALLPPRLEVEETEVQAVAQRFNLDPARQWLGLNPGAEYGPAKRWPAERFLWLAREVAAWPGWGVLIFGGKADVPAVQKIEQEFWTVANQWPAQPQLVNLAGRTSLRELMALLKHCRVLVTNDTGPMHIAAALSTKVVVPFGSTSPELTGPGLPGGGGHQLLKTDAPCAPCFLRECPIDFRCMSSISTDRVLAAVRSVLES